MPINVSQLTEVEINKVYERFRNDLTTRDLFEQEATLWKTLWSKDANPPDTLQKTLQHPSSCRTMFPNVIKALHLFLLSSVSAASVERANSSLRFIKHRLRSTMGEDRFNALILLFQHRDIDLDIDCIIDMYAS